MKRIALIGGIGRESTIVYYRLIIKKFQEILNTKDLPEILIYSVNMKEMIDLIANNHLDKLVDFFCERINVLKDSNIDYCAITSNTPHVIFQELTERIDIPLVSIVEETCKKISNSKIQKVGLLGTKATMSKGFYNTVGKKYGVEIISPQAKEQEFINEKYLNELIYNKILPSTKAQLIKIVQEMTEMENIEGLILGGTELPLILNQLDFVDLPLFDSAETHVDSIVSKMIEN